ncbi:MAG: LexA family protein, partial [Ruminococcus sp.]
MKRNDERKDEVYRFINNFIKEYGVSPSYNEIASSIKCAKSTLFKYMTRLEEEGLIERFGRNQMVTIENSNAIERIPVIGTVACGKPKLAYEDIQGYIPINVDWLGSGEYFGLVAKGDSMTNININDGDIVIVRKQDTAENGQVVVAMI